MRERMTEDAFSQQLKDAVEPVLTALPEAIKLLKKHKNMDLELRPGTDVMMANDSFKLMHALILDINAEDWADKHDPPSGYDKQKHMDAFVEVTIPNDYLNCKRRVAGETTDIWKAPTEIRLLCRVGRLIYNAIKKNRAANFPEIAL